METTLKPKELVAIFSTNVRARRKECKLTQVELAKKVGITQPYIALIESGERAPGLDMIADLATALDTTPNALLIPQVFSHTGA